MADIFISYARSDSALADRLAQAIEARGLSVWIDRKISGGSQFSEVIEREIGAARKVIVIWSAKSLQSEWVRDEASIAKEAGKLVPVVVDSSKPPIGFRQTQTLDLQSWSRGKDNLPDSLWVALLPGRAEQAPGPIERPRRAIRKWAVAGLGAALVLATCYVAYAALLTPTVVQRAERADSIPVIVRPFAAIGEPDQMTSSLASGITDELIVRLRRIAELRVGTGDRSGDMGSGAFDGAYAIDGNIRRDGEALRVTARLTDSSGRILWSDNFDRQIAELFELQETIAAKIANSLSVSLDVGSDSVAYGGTNNPEAYAAFMQYKANQYSLDQSRPLGFLQRAITLDPNYQKALAARAAAYNPQFVPTVAEANSALAAMGKYTSQMLATNPDLWMGHAARASYFLANKEFAAAQREVDRAAALDRQTDPDLPAELATISYSLGQLRQASSFVQSAVAIDPSFSRDPRVIRDDLYQGHFSDAIALYEKLEADGNEGRRNHTLEYLWALVLSGRADDALAYAEKIDGGDLLGPLQSYRTGGALPPGSLSDLRKRMHSKYGEVGQFAIANEALLASYYGHPKLAVQMMRLASERPGAYAAFVFWHPAMAKARAIPEFAQLVSDIGMVSSWRETGKWPDLCRQGSGGTVTCR